MADVPVHRDPSYPDRARIDSDVRAFLRPASSPWIVFDRDSRVDDFARAALRVGAVFASSPSMHDGSVKDAFAAGAVLTPAMSSVLPSTGVFPKTPDTTETEAALEPSNVVVATDVLDAAPVDDASFVMPPELLATRRRVFVGAAIAMTVAVIGATSFFVGTARTADAGKHATAAARVVEAAAAPVDVPPTMAAPIELDPAPGVAAPVAAAADDAKKATKFGRLNVKGEARNKQVWFDGKRLLGTGTRGFMVFCGMHTIAVNDKADAKDIEIPCNGEYAVTK